MTFDPVRLHSVESATVVVTPWTEWTFARLRAVSGASADVEITTAGDVARLVAEQVDVLKGAAIAGEADVPRMLCVDERRLSGDLPLATAVSALRTGVSIIQAVEDGITLTEALAGDPPRSVPLYANVNRGLFATQRTPADFAEAAELAVGEGFRAVKCAPFDEVTLDDGAGEAVRQARSGIQRVAAIRDRVGPNVTLMVDCHGRFDIESAVIVAEELAELGIGWFEEPVRPNVNPMGSARIAARVPMTVAGGEMGYGERMFADPDRESRGQGHHAGRDVLRRRGCGPRDPAWRQSMQAVKYLSTVPRDRCHCSPADTSPRPCRVRCHWSTLSTRRTGEGTCSSPRNESKAVACTSPPLPGSGAGLNWELLRRIGRVRDHS